MYQILSIGQINEHYFIFVASFYRNLNFGILGVCLMEKMHNIDGNQSLTKVLVTWWSFGPAEFKLLPVRIFVWWTDRTELFGHIINEFTTCR